MYHYGIKHADAIIGQAHYQNDLLQQNYSRSCDAIIPNFHPFPDKKIEKAPSPIKVYWIANIKDKKRPEKFIELAKSFADNEKIQFIMIGAIHSQNWQEQIPRVVGQVNNLAYKGAMPIEKVNEELESAHIFVNTSTSEGFPNTFVQAWMREVPVVSLTFDSDNIITQNELGFVSGSFEQMVKDVKQLSEDDALWQQIGKHAKAFAREHFSLENIGKITGIFHKLHNVNTYSQL